MNTFWQNIPAKVVSQVPSLQFICLHNNVTRLTVHLGHIKVLKMDIKIDISIIRNPPVQFSSSTLDKSQSSILFEAGNDLNSEALDHVTSSEAVVKLDVLVSAIFSSLEASESGNSSTLT